MGGRELLQRIYAVTVKVSLLTVTLYFLRDIAAGPNSTAPEVLN